MVLDTHYQALPPAPYFYLKKSQRPETKMFECTPFTGVVNRLRNREKLSLSGSVCASDGES
jgi:hypothetical protein